MADSELDLFEIQVGKETTWGTAVAPTKKLMGVESCEISTLHESEHIPEMRGDLTPAYNAVVNRFTGEASIEGTIVYEDILYFIESMFYEDTPSGTGPYVYQYAGAGAKPSPRIMTLVKGSGEGVYCLAGAICNTLEMTFEPNARATYSAGFIGENIEADALVTLGDTAVNVCHGNQVSLYIDDFGAAAGTTIYNGVKTSASISLDMARSVKAGLGSLTPVGWKQAKADPGGNQLTLSLEFDNTTDYSKDLYDELIATTLAPFRKVVRLKAAIAATHLLQIDFAGFSPEAPTLFGDADGIATLEFTLNALYESTLANWIEIEVQNSLASLS